MKKIVSTRVIAAIASVPFAIALAACSSDTTDAAASSDSSTSAAATTTTAPEMTTEAPMAAGPFGAACSAVPATGAGSFDGMAKDPVATAASNNPVLSTLVAAVTAANLGDTLNTTQDITVFAPTNDAFAALPKETLDAAMADPSGLLTTVLTHHVVAGKLSPEQVAGTHTTLAGDTITVTGSGEAFMVGTANVVCGNVQTANATVYIIDQVLLPA